ncbi:hypothetical protein A3G56_02845 [Candidatus Falkowbacteria bacterium RIFCSPLOWO2_12_FULL_45_10]|uniref:Uncharacterized protein n=1 Tax=Candidatus Falkowbacteria bacterium RIFCSPLOWO2_12_FULL_45_10 TaxID=1797990 RepID=A0A1F5RVZ2_9BACT|nr:MAG: hypothetical protein A3G56_02845 [Candidatus Falkowbacteria bacterium RIFCSPLOWO2_12_FULL_45_10]
MLRYKQKLIISFLTIAATAAVVGFFINNQEEAAQAQTGAVNQPTSQNDGLAVRVMPNDQHLSPLEWYKTNIKQQGAPSRLLVDGYEALQEGRTIYVNAANVDNNNLYTNIYIISYTQEASSATREIFNQLLNNWTFNANITAQNLVGACVKIIDNSPDPAGQRCYTDAQCGKNTGLYCNSRKAQITRDVRRMADLKEIDSALADYRQSHNNQNPELAAGSYIAGKTISVWPSWQATLGQALGKTLPTDPLNKLVGCVDPSNDGTCWHEEEKRFGDVNANHSIPDNLPVGSHVYAYTYTSQGRPVCAVMETTYSVVDAFNCQPK